MHKKWTIAFVLLLLMVLTACEEKETVKLSKPTEPSSDEVIPKDQAKSSLPPDLVSEKKAEKTAVETMNKISSTYKELGEEYEWENESNPADYETLKKALTPYATSSLIATKLKSISTNYYCKECNMSFFPDVTHLIRFELINNHAGQFSVSAIEPISKEGSGGLTIYMNFKYVNKNWKLNEWDEVTYHQKYLNITSDEYIEYVKSINPSSDISYQGESTRTNEKGEKEEILVFKENNETYAISKNSSQRIDDFKEDEKEKEEKDFDLKNIQKVDQETADIFIEHYLRDLTKSINTNKFEHVQPYIEQDSVLWNDQKQLVKMLYERDIREELVDYSVLDVELANEEDDSVYTIRTKEVISITTNGQSQEKEYYRTYTVSYNDKQLHLTKIESL
ncbi:TcaA NTF2-like domain-containing protein [Priestia megaterium]|uniref:TcaA NTF2-like domain-containing protein n=1 Tax=Priestia megaterium TaxID=1404 RepID=UPI000CA157FE|nr:hypothetical protein [Priestia megaterium]AUO14246.1 hypothetical protein C0569_24035 [Priestia megaterium]